MPEIGEIKRGESINKKPFGMQFIYHACVDCGKGRWSALKVKSSLPKSPRCLHCENLSRRMPKGITTGQGYIHVHIEPSDAYYMMAIATGYVLEHRLVVARSLGRCLARNEMVHHINGIRNDNRIENLELVSRASHSVYTTLCAHCELRKEIRLLRWHIKEQSEQIRQLTGKLTGI